MIRVRLHASPIVLLLAAVVVRAETPTFVEVPTSTEVRETFGAGEREIPERFQRRPATFTVSAETRSTVGTIRSYDVSFPSPYVSESRTNNTVHGVYFQPSGTGPFPGCVLLHELGGDPRLVHTVADLLARRGVATYAIALPYYGRRRAPDSRRRLVSFDPARTVESVTQAVHDVRRSVVWIATRGEVDARTVGVTGISMGAFIGATAAAVEPRVARTALVLGGGDVATLVWDHWDPQAKSFRKRWEEAGGSRDTLARALAEVEPTTHAKRLKERPVLMIAATRDEIVPRSSTMALYEAAGRKPELVWLESGHVSSVVYLFREVDRLAKFLGGTPKGAVE